MRTSSSRAASRSPSGTENGMPAATILRLVRTSRWAIVVSGTRNARATWAVVRPSTARSVSASRDSADSAGWQQANSIGSRSSGVPPPGSSGSRGTASASAAATDPASRCRRERARSRSTARRWAVVVNHPAGLGGTPRDGQVRSASTSASCTASSATSKSPVRRCRWATTTAASRRTTRDSAESSGSGASGAVVRRGSGVTRSCRPPCASSPRPSGGSRPRRRAAAARARCAPARWRRPGRGRRSR